MKLRLTIVLASLLFYVGQSELVKVVDNGVLTKNADLRGKSWKQDDGFVSGANVGEFLYLKPSLRKSPFEIKLRLSLEKMGHTAAGVKIGSVFFGFDSPKGMFIEGGGMAIEFFKEAAKLIEKSKPFDFKSVYNGSQLVFFVNDQEICSKTINLSKLSKVAVRPHRSSVKVYDFSVSGDIFSPKPLPYVFKSGTDGYHTYRIPAIVRSTKGTLLAFAEGRVNHSGDSGNLDIVLRRSTDNGKTWQELIVVQDDGNNQCGNAAPVVDQKSGRIFMLSCGSTSSEHAVMQGHATREVYIQHSDDDGLTWTERRNISSMTRKKEWRWYATGPCSGIQIRSGKHRGRLVVPANHSYHDEKTNVYRAHSLYSDDSGETWHIGAEAGNGSNESQIAEAGEDLLYHTMRMQSHSQRMRGTRYSKDGGENWSELQHDFSLHGPRCQGSVVRDYSKKSRLVFSNPAKFGRRENMTIRVSEDGGKSWPFRKRVFEGPAAYSDLVMMKKRVGILFEGGYGSAYEGIIFNSFSYDDLLVKEPAVSQIPEAKMGWNIWRDRFNSFNQQAEQGDIDLLLLGDSITHYWQKNRMCKTDGQKVWDEFFKGKKVANFGIGSDRTQHLLYRLRNGNLKNIQPKAVILMIGTNNTSSGHSAYDIFLGTRDIIAEVQKQCPKTKIFLYDIFPRLRNGQAALDNNERVNVLIKELCDGENVVHCSINKQLLDENGKPSKAIFFDGIHLNEQGYRIWAEDILQLLKRHKVNLK